MQIFIIPGKFLSDLVSKSLQDGAFMLVHQPSSIAMSDSIPKRVDNGGCGLMSLSVFAGGLAPISILRTTFFVQFWSPLGNLDWHHPLIASKYNSEHFLLLPCQRRHIRDLSNRISNEGVICGRREAVHRQVHF